MKGFKSVTDIQRAKLLFEWFPSQMTEFIAFETEIAQLTIQEREKIKNSNAENQLFPTVTWIRLAENTLSRIKQHEGKISSSPTIFSEQLFEGDNGFFSKYCLQQFTSSKIKDEKLREAVKLFFY
ncbi:hypothetical protein PV783_13705 [Chitinophaga sp. CC14]|uniref:hypothetical protein n=1 Tax=Chitinophaga sp. CC14 TaxID=3029199 RepID=UPI003B7F2144